MNANDIKAACKIYNQGHDDCIKDIATGIPQVRVHYCGKQGSKNIVFSACTGVATASGFIAAADPAVMMMPRGRRFRGTFDDVAARFGRKHADASVPVVVRAGSV